MFNFRASFHRSLSFLNQKDRKMKAGLFATFLRNLYIFSPYTYFLFFRQVDELRASLYAPFKPELSHKGSIDINDVQGSGDIVTSSFDPTLVPLPPIGPLKRTVLIQVNLFQKHLLLHQLTHNMKKDCSWNYQENYKNIGRTCFIHVLRL